MADLDLSGYTPEQLRAIAATGVVPDGSLPGNGSDGPMQITVGGRPMEDLSPHELRAVANAPPERGALDQAVHSAGVGGRAIAQGAVSGVLGLPGLVTDAVTGVGRDIVYATHKGLGAIGVADAPNPESYGYGKEGWTPNVLGGADDAPTAFPMSALATKAARAIPDAVGLPEPETRNERIGSAMLEGMTSGLTGAGTGAALAKLGPAGVKGIGQWLATGPKEQIVAGGFGGAGSQGAAESGVTGAGQTAAGIATSTIPALLSLRNFGKARGGPPASNTPQGQEYAAAIALQNMAKDPELAAANLDKAGDTKIKGFRHTTTNAAQDPGLGTLAQNMNDWANVHQAGAIGDIKAHNNTILSTALDRLAGVTGHDPDTGIAIGGPNETRALATAKAGAAFKDMALETLPNIDVKDIIQKLENESNVRVTGSEDKSAAAAAMRDRIAEVAKPRYSIGADGKPTLISWDISPKALHDARLDILKKNKPNVLQEPNKTAQVARAQGYTSEVMREHVGGKLNEATGGAYGDYLKEQRAIRGHADTQEYMQDLKNASSDKVPLPNRASQINPGSFLGRLTDSKADRPMPNGNRSMSLDKLKEFDPVKHSFVRGMAEDLNKASYDTGRGMGSGGSPTAKNKDIRELIKSEVRANASTGDKILTGGAIAMNALATATGKGVGLVAGPGAGAVVGGGFRLGANLGNRLAGARAMTAEQGVQNVLGRAQIDPAYAAQLLRMGPVERARMMDLIANGTGRLTRDATQGFLAGERTARYR